MLAIISGRMHSPLEAAFLWLGGWRPTAAVVLVYSIMGVQINEETQQPALGPEVFHCVPLLSERQLSRINSLQIYSRQVEADISDRLAMIQMLIPDEELLAALNLGEAAANGTQDLPQARQLLDSKLMNIRELLTEADQLRLHTLQELFLLLNPVQGARCCLAGYELVFAVKTLGNAPLEQVQLPTVPQAAIPVPVPMFVPEASTSVAVLPPEVLPLLVPLELVESLSLPPLAPIPIPIPVTMLRRSESLSEIQMLSNTFPLAVQLHRAPDRVSSGDVDCLNAREGSLAKLPPAVLTQAFEVSESASVCTTVPCPNPVIETTAATAGTDLRADECGADQLDLWRGVVAISHSEPSAGLASSSTKWHDAHDSNCTDKGCEDCQHPP
eukprot:TRINITY_DN1602_c0_g1_i1.p1 TRINITY_DN1602_c0_g1~~TRINITY_DN1602_c0_g1_i1.p1  ORF type:complete len:385 (-),score=31.28 TRINITY_DN1602_c0_g1_i1:502-1656(-)